MTRWHYLLGSSFSRMLRICLPFAIACNTRYAYEPYTNHICIPADTSELEIWHVGHPQCQWRCLKTEQCRYFNHNMSAGQCELGLGQCATLVPASGVVVNAYGPERDTCLHWSAAQQTTLKPIWIFDGFTDLYVARVVVGEGLVLGKLLVYDNHIYCNHEGTIVIFPYDETPGRELLLTDPACTLAWLQYTMMVHRLMW